MTRRKTLSLEAKGHPKELEGTIRKCSALDQSLIQEADHIKDLMVEAAEASGMI